MVVFDNRKSEGAFRTTEAPSLFPLGLTEFIRPAEAVRAEIVRRPAAILAEECAALAANIDILSLSHFPAVPATESVHNRLNLRSFLTEYAPFVKFLYFGGAKNFLSSE